MFVNSIPKSPIISGLLLIFFRALQRTVIVPPEAGYGQKGMNEIPVNYYLTLNNHFHCSSKTRFKHFLFCLPLFLDLNLWNCKTNTSLAHLSHFRTATYFKTLFTVFSGTNFAARSFVWSEYRTFRSKTTRREVRCIPTLIYFFSVEEMILMPNCSC